MAAPFVRRPTDDGTSGTREDIIKSLDMGKGKARDAVLARKKDGIGLLHAAACQGHLTVCKFLMEELGGFIAHLIHAQDAAGADVNNKGTGITPLMFAALQGCYTYFIKILLETGAIPNIPNVVRKELKCYFHSHPQIPNVPNWSVDGIISHAKVNHTKPTDQHQESRKAILKSHADLAFRQKNYDCAAKVYDLTRGPTAVLYANKSICRLLMGDGEGALSDGDAE
ncbi:hypothetical protein OsI_00716 [Oryza sativa Indica Group]|uniref:Uncharacterized protein n=1 Tax=Oryza sativa subsp. indica TaxID=39946 RepID=B8ADP1_ORYSI|nr:hypothetical protein OsI_00716 [Oryza sativa Indica Group]